MKRPPPPDPQRRKLLGTARDLAAVGAAATVLPASAALPAGSAPAATDATPPAPRGYHETDHTRAYYRLARY
jgi:hypothetical protein